MGKERLGIFRKDPKQIQNLLSVDPKQRDKPIVGPTVTFKEDNSTLGEI